MENANIGNHTFQIDLNDDSLFNNGLFRVYLLQNNVPTDSGNIIRVKFEDLHLLREKQMVLCEHGLTNQDGKVIPKTNINKWFGSKIYRTSENGMILNKYQVNDNLLVAVIDNTGKMIKETIVKYNVLVERGLTLKIVYYKIK